MSMKEIKDAMNWLRRHREDIVAKNFVSYETIDKQIEILKKELLFLTKDNPETGRSGKNTIFINKIHEIAIMTARVEARQKNRARTSDEASR